MVMRTHPTSRSVEVPGPTGTLQTLVDLPAVDVPARVAVICHPHPLHGGALTNKVVHMLAKSCNDVGGIAVRFNFRGVGHSAGTYAQGEGETDDAVAVAQWAATQWPGAELWFAGFSFGGAVAIRAAARTAAKRLITVAPAIRRVPVDSATLPTCPWLIVQGDRDELVDARDLQAWAASLQVRPELTLLSGVDHFFHGRLNELRDAVVKWLSVKVDG